MTRVDGVLSNAIWREERVFFDLGLIDCWMMAIRARLPCGTVIRITQSPYYEVLPMVDPIGSGSSYESVFAESEIIYPR